MVYGIAKMLNFAHGDVIMVGGYIAFCSITGLGWPPLLAVLASVAVCTALGIISIYTLYKQLTNYRKLYPSVSWLHTFRLSLVTCLLAGLLTDAVQYLYFLFLDNGRLLSVMGNAFQSEEYREAWKQMMPDVNLDEMQKMIQSLSVRDIMLQLVFSNIVLALPISLLAALPVRAPQPQKGEKDKS